MAVIVGAKGADNSTPQIKVSAKDLVSISCEKCKNQTFAEVLLLKKISALLSPNGKESIVPIPVMACNSCGWVNKEFLPKVE